jgi:hypothetical protein
MPEQVNRRQSQSSSPIDRLIRLIAEIEVARYVEEVKRSDREGTEHESSDLRT